jgi:hypothetical protein
MIRQLVCQPFTEDKIYALYAGLSTDSKPTEGIITGSLFLEADTGRVWTFDEVGALWTKIGGGE